jgi:hypothetical protein
VDSRRSNTLVKSLSTPLVEILELSHVEGNWGEIWMKLNLRFRKIALSWMNVFDTLSSQLLITDDLLKRILL